MLVEPIRRYYNEKEKERKWDSPLRCSNAGKCPRAIAYQYHNYEPNPLNFRAAMVFRLGDLIESDLVDALINCYPDFVAGTEYMKYVGGDLYKSYEQIEVNLTISGLAVTGHLDGYIQKEGKPYVVVDCKSMASYSFERYEKGEVDDSYRAQGHCYMKGMNVDKFLLLGYNKNTSALVEVPLKWDDRVWAKIEDTFAKVGASTPEALPAKGHSPNAKGILPWQCSYCAFVRHCWPDYQLTFSNHGKPILKVKI